MDCTEVAFPFLFFCFVLVVPILSVLYLCLEKHIICGMLYEGKEL